MDDKIKIFEVSHLVYGIKFEYKIVCDDVERALKISNSLCASAVNEKYYQKAEQGKFFHSLRAINIDSIAYEEQKENGSPSRDELMGVWELSYKAYCTLDAERSKSLRMLALETIKDFYKDKQK